MTSFAFLIKLKNPYLKRLMKIEVILQEKEQFILFIQKKKRFSHKRVQKKKKSPNL